MVYAVICIISLIALVNLLFLHASFWMSLAALLLTLIGFLLLVLSKGQAHGLKKIVAFLCIGAGILFLWNAGERIRPEGIRSYESMLKEVRDQLAEGNYDKAAEGLGELEEAYGPDDTIRLLRAVESLGKGNYEEAFGHTRSIEDKSSILYYAVMEQIYIADPSEQSVDDIYAMYLEAAQAWPDWTRMQKYAGIALFEQGQYAGAEYYLLRARIQDGTDYQTVYYLGAVDYYRNDYESSREYFNQALELGADEGIQSEILWYLEAMNEEESR